MADIEKLIKGLKCCNEKKVRLCEECPYDDENSLDDCLYLLTTDALELLKEQEQIINSLKSDLQETLKVVSEQSNVIRCKDCKHRDPEDGKCDSGHGIQWQLPRPDDWFCADGEQRTEV